MQHALVYGHLAAHRSIVPTAHRRIAGAFRSLAGGACERIFWTSYGLAEWAVGDP